MAFGAWWGHGRGQLERDAHEEGGKQEEGGSKSPSPSVGSQEAEATASLEGDLYLQSHEKKPHTHRKSTLEFPNTFILCLRLRIASLDIPNFRCHL